MKHPRGLRCGAGALALAGTLFSGAQAAPPQSAPTLWALNCMGCHTRPTDFTPVPGRSVQFAHTELGRVFYMEMPAGGRPLTPDEDARLRHEILTWKASCHAILQNAPTVRYSGEDHVR